MHFHKIRLSLECIYLLLLIFGTSQITFGYQDDNSEFQSSSKPNIVIILIDDMGFNDVSFHGSNQFLTPNIDALAFNGIILNNNYVPNLCTPSRASLLTGKYPIHTGTQHHVIINDEPWGLPLEEQLMPEIFRDAGYSTNLVGKWHLGFYEKELTPLFRGFDHHYGYYSGFIGYFDHTIKENNYTGLDFRNDLQPLPEASGNYATDLFTQEGMRIIGNHNISKPLFLLMSHLAVHTGNVDNPMEALEEDLNKFQYITDTKRRTYAAMVSRLDDSVGQTIKALDDKGILNNTIILLYSDNGAPTVGSHGNAGSNYPFKGQKYSPWEGGIRSASLIWSPLLKQKNYVFQQVTHSIDWLPTLASAAGLELPQNLKLDGIDLWSALSEAYEPQSRRLLHALDDIIGYSAYTRDNIKYINGTTNGGKYDDWVGDIATEETDPKANSYEQEILASQVHMVIGDNKLSAELIKQLRTEATISCPANENNVNLESYKCEPLKSPCLFDISKDPCERYNLANLYPLKLQIFSQEVNEYRLTARPSARVPIADPNCDPERFGGNWQWWREADSNSSPNSFSPSAVVGLSTILSALYLT